MFQKTGADANSNGRPLKGAALTDVLRRMLDMSIDDFAIYQPQTVKEQIAHNLIVMGQGSQSPFAIRELFDRIEGRPEQKQIITGDAFEPLTILHVHKTTDNTDGKTGDSLGSSDEKPDT